MGLPLDLKVRIIITVTIFADITRVSQIQGKRSLLMVHPESDLNPLLFEL